MPDTSDQLDAGIRAIQRNFADAVSDFRALAAPIVAENVSLKAGNAAKDAKIAALAKRVQELEAAGAATDFAETLYIGDGDTFDGGGRIFTWRGKPGGIAFVLGKGSTLRNLRLDAAPETFPTAFVPGDDCLVQDVMLGPWIGLGWQGNNRARGGTMRRVKWPEMSPSRRGRYLAWIEGDDTTLESCECGDNPSEFHVRVSVSNATAPAPKNIRILGGKYRAKPGSKGTIRIEVCDGAEVAGAEIAGVVVVGPDHEDPTQAKRITRNVRIHGLKRWEDAVLQVRTGVENLTIENLPDVHADERNVWPTFIDVMGRDRYGRVSRNIGVRNVHLKRLNGVGAFLSAHEVEGDLIVRDCTYTAPGMQTKHNDAAMCKFYGPVPKGFVYENNTAPAGLDKPIVVNGDQRATVEQATQVQPQ